MAREFRIKLSDDLSEADVYMAIREKADELMVEGDLDCWLDIEVKVIEDKAEFEEGDE